MVCAKMCFLCEYLAAKKHKSKHSYYKGMFIIFSTDIKLISNIKSIWNDLLPIR